MNKKSITLVATLLISFFLGCAENSERQFQDIAGELKHYLTRLDQIKPDVSESRSFGQETITLDLSARAAFVDDHKDEFASIAARLDAFSSSGVDSDFRDDAAFLVVMEYLSISIPGNGYHAKAIEKIDLFLSEYPDFKIDEWTKRYFNDITLFHVLDKEKVSDADLFGQEELELTINERVEAFLLFSLVSEHLAVGDFTGAEKRYEEIVNSGKYEWFNEDMQFIISAHKAQRQAQQ